MATQLPPRDSAKDMSIIRVERDMVSADSSPMPRVISTAPCIRAVMDDASSPTTLNTGASATLAHWNICISVQISISNENIATYPHTDNSEVIATFIA